MGNFANNMFEKSSRIVDQKYLNKKFWKGYANV